MVPPSDRSDGGVARLLPGHRGRYEWVGSPIARLGPQALQNPRFSPMAARIARSGIPVSTLLAAMAAGPALAGVLHAATPVGRVVASQDSPSQVRAAWRDRTTEVAVAAGVSVRSDLPRDRTSAVLAGESAAVRRLVDLWGQPSAARRLWCFASRGDFEDTLRTEFGVDARGREAVFIDHRGDRLVAVCDAAVAEDRFARDLAASIAERHLLDQGPAAPPWLRAALPAWFGEAMAYGRWNPGIVGASTRESLAAAATAGRLIGIDRVIALEPGSWRANQSAGSGPLQAAEAVALLSTLIGDPADRDAAAAARRMALGRWWRQLQAGVEPRGAWMEVFGVPLAAPVRAAVEATMARSPSDLERAIREARWLAEGRLHLEARGETVEEPEELRRRLFESGYSLEEPCIAASGRCPWRPAAVDSMVWSPTLAASPVEGGAPTAGRPADGGREVWTGAVGPTLLEVRWTRSTAGGWRYSIRADGR